MPDDPRARLALANWLLAESQKPAAPGEEDRKLAGYQIVALFEIAVAVGVPMRLLARTRRLLGDLEDLDRGKTSKQLTATRPPQARPADNTVLWEARSAAVAAYEARVDLGERPKQAATVVDRDIGLKRFGVRAPPYRTLLRWRADFAVLPGLRAPPEGLHWGVLETARAERQRCKGLAQTDPHRAREGLQALYRGMIKHADRLLPGGPQHFAGKGRT